VAFDQSVMGGVVQPIRGRPEEGVDDAQVVDLLVVLQVFGEQQVQPLCCAAATIKASQ
jgi:hypothetical protein